MMKQTFIYRLWRENVTQIFFSAFALIGMEWLFIITKPSFLSLSSLIEKITVLGVSGIFLTAVLIIISVPFVILAAIFFRKNRLAVFLIAIIPSITYSCLGLLLFDNFTYTVFKIGIVNSSGVTRIGYLLGLFLLFGSLLRVIQAHLHQVLTREWQPKYRWYPITFTLSTIILSGLVVFPFAINSSLLSKKDLSNTVHGSRPNIILLTADGVNANHLSVYGYERQTTPFLDSQKERLILGDNHFTNSGNTSGSITSILTSKLPTTTRVLYPPDKLRGTDTTEHLPEILRGQGYYTAQLSVRHFVDANELNFQDAFMEVNGVLLTSQGLSFRINQRFPTNSKLFIQEVESRLRDRLGHIFFIKNMENTYNQITQTQTDFNDLEKIQQTEKIIMTHAEPVFIHIHWMGTHGSHFYPTEILFSKGIDRSNQEPWNQDLYDDAILDFDNAVAGLYDYLEMIGEAKNSIILITSDHGQKFTVEDRLPLVILLPNSKQNENPYRNTQNLDISPTILDFLEIPKPIWMKGQSIINNSMSNGLIIAVAASKSKISEGEWVLDPEYLQPPFYQFDSISAIDCDRFYRLNLENFHWSEANVEDHMGTCQKNEYLSPAKIRNAIIGELKTDKFEFDADQVPEIPSGK